MAQDEVRAHLETVVASELFVRSGRLGHFLRFVVEETLAGRGDGLKEYAIGVAVYGRRDFDPRLDSAVRVDARRLRLKLEEYYTGPGAGAPLRITIPKGGYVPSFERETGAAAPPANPHLPRWPVAALLLGAILLVAYFFVRFGSSHKVTVVAVAPFTNLTGDKAMDSICAGLEEEVRHRAARLAGLRVVAGGQGDVWNMARELHVDGLISGSVRSSGQKLRLSAQWVRVSDRGTDWSETVDLETGDALAMQTRLGEMVERRLRSSGAAVATVPEGTEGELRARLERVAFLRQRRSRAAIEKAIEEARAVQAEWPKNALAKALEADAMLLLSEYFQGDEHRQMVEDARRKAEEALDLDGGLAIAHSTLGLLRMRYDWKWSEAENLLRRAVWLEPESAVALIRLARWLTAQGMHEEAAPLAERARIRAPLAPQVVSAAGHIAYYAGRYRDAVRLMEEALDLDPGFVGLHITRVRALHLAGETEQAQREFLRLPAAMREGAEFRALETWLWAKAGTRTAPAFTRANPIAAAGSWLALGEKDRALQSLRKGVEERDGSMEFLKVTPVLEGLRTEPALEEICRQAGLRGCVRN